MNLVSIERRLTAIEQRRASTGRQMHVIKATDIADRDRQIADLVATGTVRPLDGFLCVLGRPMVQ